MLAKKLGEKPLITCKHCLKQHKYHVNDIKAVPNKTILLLSLAVFLIGTGVVITFIWDIIFRLSNVYMIVTLTSLAGVPYLMYEAVDNAQNQKVKYFNIKIYG